MNGHLFRNLLLHMLAFVLHYSGLGRGIWKLVRVPGLYIFNYHGFNTFLCDYRRFGSLFESGYQGRFDRQMRFFKRRLAPIKDFPPRKSELAAFTFCVTFDDGYRDNHSIALPILVKRRIPAVFLVTTGVIGTNDLLWYDRFRWDCEQGARLRPWNASRLKRRCRRELNERKSRGREDPKASIFPKAGDAHPRLMMNWEEVAQASAAGISIGSHTHTHPVLARLDTEGQRREIADSLAVIKQRLGRNADLFAFPDGGRSSYGPETLDLLAEMGINHAFTTIDGVNRDLERPLELKRIGINPSDGIPLVALKLLRAALRERGGGRT